MGETDLLLVHYIAHQMIFDPYSILHISKQADASQIRKAYHKQAMLHHPDKSGDQNSEKMRHINLAYAVLQDSRKRKMIDQGLYNPLEDEPDDDIYVPPVFKKPHTQQVPLRKGEIRRFRVIVTLAELFNNVEYKSKFYSYDKLSFCTACEGTGCAEKRLPFLCSCVGEHRRLRDTIDWDIKCGRCNKNRYIAQTPQCTTCNGQFVIRSTKLLEIKPERMREGEVICFPGLGHDRYGFSSGDLFVTIHLHIPKPWSVSKKGQLVRDLDIPLKTAVSKPPFVFTDPNGKEVEAFHSKAIKPDTHIELEGQGLPISKGVRGTLIIFPKIVFPDELISFEPSQDGDSISQ
jgi:DnaJ-class molecular chaperone